MSHVEDVAPRPSGEWTASAKRPHLPDGVSADRCQRRSDRSTRLDAIRHGTDVSTTPVVDVTVAVTPDGPIIVNEYSLRSDDVEYNTCAPAGIGARTMPPGDRRVAPSVVIASDAGHVPSADAVCSSTNAAVPTDCPNSRRSASRGSSAAAASGSAAAPVSTAGAEGWFAELAVALEVSGGWSPRATQWAGAGSAMLVGASTIAVTAYAIVAIVAMPAVMPMPANTDRRRPARRYRGIAIRPAHTAAAPKPGDPDHTRWVDHQRCCESHHQRGETEHDARPREHDAPSIAVDMPGTANGALFGVRGSPHRVVLGWGPVSRSGWLRTHVARLGRWMGCSILPARRKRRAVPECGGFGRARCSTTLSAAADIC